MSKVHDLLRLCKEVDRGKHMRNEFFISEKLEEYKSGFYKVNEMAPYAVDGDWPIEREDKGVLGQTRKYMMKDTFKKLPVQFFTDKLKDFIKRTGEEIFIAYSTDNKYSMIVGVYSTKSKDPEKDYERYSLLTTNRYEAIENPELVKKFPNLYQSAEISTRLTHRNNGMAESIYLSMLHSGFQLISDYTQYDGARGLWRKLSQNSELNMYVYDEREDKILAEGHKITNIEYDNLDKEWTKDWFSKERQYLFIVEISKD